MMTLYSIDIQSILSLPVQNLVQSNHRPDQVWVLIWLIGRPKQGSRFHAIPFDP